MDKKVNISQSLIKDFAEYKQGKFCGLQFVAKYVDGMPFPSTDTQRLGQWFEYMCTGALPKHGETPEPDRTQKGELTAPYKKMQVQVENFKRAKEYYKLTIFEKGKKLIWKDIEGTIDIIGHMPGYGKVIIDIKSTGLLNNKWDDMGWEIETLAEKEKLMLQPIHYKYLSMKHFAQELPFFFFVHSNTNEIEHIIIEVEIDPEKLERHEELINNVRKSLYKELNKGFIPCPDIKRCHDCPLKADCKYFRNVPEIVKIYYS